MEKTLEDCWFSLSYIYIFLFNDVHIFIAAFRCTSAAGDDRASIVEKLSQLAVVLGYIYMVFKDLYHSVS